MRATVALLSFAIAAVSGDHAVALMDNNKCIIDASSRVPNVAGMIITGANARELTAAEAKRWHHVPNLPLIVNVSVRAAGRDAIYYFLCGETYMRPLVDGKLPE